MLSADYVQRGPIVKVSLLAMGRNIHRNVLKSLQMNVCA